MDIYTTLFIMVFCLMGSIWTSYRAGLREGATQILMVLEEAELIVIDEEGNIESR